MFPTKVRDRFKIRDRFRIRVRLRVRLRVRDMYRFSVKGKKHLFFNIKLCHYCTLEELC